MTERNRRKTSAVAAYVVGALADIALPTAAIAGPVLPFAGIAPRPLERRSPARYPSLYFSPRFCSREFPPHQIVQSIVSRRFPAKDKKKKVVGSWVCCAKGNLLPLRFTFLKFAQRETQWKTSAEILGKIQVSIFFEASDRVESQTGSPIQPRSMLRTD